MRMYFCVYIPTCTSPPFLINMARIAAEGFSPTPARATRLQTPFLWASPTKTLQKTCHMSTI